MLNDEKLLFLLKWGKNASFSSYLHLRIGLDRVKAVVFLLTQLSMSGLMYLPVFAIQSTILAACLVDAADFAEQAILCCMTLYLWPLMWRPQ